MSRFDDPFVGVGVHRGARVDPRQDVALVGRPDDRLQTWRKWHPPGAFRGLGLAANPDVAGEAHHGPSNPHSIALAVLVAQAERLAFAKAELEGEQDGHALMRRRVLDHRAKAGYFLRAQGPPFVPVTLGRTIGDVVAGIAQERVNPAEPLAGGGGAGRLAGVPSPEVGFGDAGGVEIADRVAVDRDPEPLTVGFDGRGRQARRASFNPRMRQPR